MTRKPKPTAPSKKTTPPDKKPVRVVIARKAVPPALKAHPAFRLHDEAALDALKKRLSAAGIATREDREIEDAARFFADDPWGNRLEFVASRALP